MIQPVTLTDLGDFMNMIFTAFAEPMLLSFSAMIAFAVAYGIKNLLVDGLR